MTVLVGCAVGLASPALADDAEDKAIAFVENLRGKLTRDEKQSEKPVVGVELRGPKITDAMLKELAVFKNLIILDISLTEVTDVGLKELATLKNLTHLNLRWTKVTDAGLKELASLKNLTHLGLRDTKVTAAGVKELAPLKNLSDLSLEMTNVGGSRNSPRSKASPRSS